MQAQSNPAVRCNHCQETVALVDEHGRCERCITGAQQLAWSLDDLDMTAADVAARGLTAAQVRAAVDLALADNTGRLPALSLKVRRRGER